jgi:hypothetical protein
MRLFRRFRFQPTRAESELGMMPYLVGGVEISRSTDGGDESAFVEYAMAEEIYSQMVKRLERDYDLRQPDIMRGLQNLDLS